MAYSVSLKALSFVLASAASCASAATKDYDSFAVGKLEGKLLLQWVEPDKFLFIPDKSKPLKFTRHDGAVIQPGRMLTDGGSIPRPLWILRSYSPWGFGPAFIVHDWLFEMKHCSLRGHEVLNHHLAADVMAEVMKTMMEIKRVEIDKATLMSMHTAVDSSIAERRWAGGKCIPAPADFRPRNIIAEYEIDFD